MTRTRFEPLGQIGRRLVQRLSLVLLLAACANLVVAEFEFQLQYPDIKSKLSPEVKLERLVRLLEEQRHVPHRQQDQDQDGEREQQQQPGLEPLPQQLALQQQEELEELEEIELQRKHQAAIQRKQQQLYRKQQQHLLDLARQKQRGVLRDDLPERPNIIDILQRKAADPLEYVRELERQRLLPYLEYEPPRVKQYSVEDEARARLLPQLNKDPLLDYPETPREAQYMDLKQRARYLQDSARRLVQEAHRHRPSFTYSFDKPVELSCDAESAPFAVGPNDPRFYEEDPQNKEALEEASDPRESADQRSKANLASYDDVVESRHLGMHFEQNPAKGQPMTPTRANSSGKDHGEHRVDGLSRSAADAGMSMMPEPQRRASQNPLVVSLVEHKVNNDIYFVAIVAGCSAAAMFTLVLISLTWCRLQNASKATANVEYPAYGVTGPNKDISPSGDQRLAQSAQMYHFQHQKQQIIAMENRASATRDPGSVSEAESDEENEEGDYTVYECPGLAPTGEMEVKNPLFHDDPTPASPAKSSKRLDDV